MCYDRGMNDRSKDLVLAALTVQGIPPTARMLLVTLIIVGDDTDAGRAAICSRRNLSAIMGVTHRSVHRAARSLEQAGLLARSRRIREDGGDVASVYTVLTDRLAPEEPR